MDLFTITVAVVSGAAVGAGLAYAGCKARIAGLNRYIDATSGLSDAHVDAIYEQLNAVEATLRNLRRNCFVRNAAGNRVRYTNATAEERAKAEGAV